MSLKVYGGYLPRIEGRPLSVVEERKIPALLTIPLTFGTQRYAPAVSKGERVEFGDSLATWKGLGGQLHLPSPAAGVISAISQGEEPAISIRVSSGEVKPVLDPMTPQRATDEQIRQALCRSGLWPLIWSQKTGGPPIVNDTCRPRALIVNCVLAEPFRVRGKVILRRSWRQVMEGIKFMPRLMTDYSSVDIVLTARRDPVARMMYDDLAGHAWVRFHPVPLAYPVESPAILARALRRSGNVGEANDIWVVTVQDMAAIGSCLAEGIPLHERAMAVGGPGQPTPKHLCARIGTPLKDLLPLDANPPVRILRGGLLNGVPVNPETDHVQWRDDAFFFLPDREEREMLSFVRPGADRTSAFPCFLSRLLGGYDRQVSTRLRGERRACIACGMCETLCPAQLLPQVLHRLLYAGDLDAAEVTGLDRCVDCRLCSYLCPSKLDLQQEFADAKATLAKEREEAEAMAEKEEAEGGTAS